MRLVKRLASPGATKLSAYDAAYLELAMRSGLPLATLDADLAKAVTTAGVPIFGIH
jgi:predicted nucleic acid-binding protein